MRKNPSAAVLLSLVLPGSGQIYVGERSKAVVIFFMDLGVISSSLLSSSLIAKIFIGLIYFFIIVHASIDAYKSARGNIKPLGSESRAYVIFMLFALGPFALPLLWKNKSLFLTGKVVLTILVIIIVVLSFITISLTGSFLEDILL